MCSPSLCSLCKMSFWVLIMTQRRKFCSVSFEPWTQISSKLLCGWNSVLSVLTGGLGSWLVLVHLAPEGNPVFPCGGSRVQNTETKTVSAPWRTAQGSELPTRHRQGCMSNTDLWHRQWDTPGTLERGNQAPACPTGEQGNHVHWEMQDCHNYMFSCSRYRYLQKNSLLFLCLQKSAIRSLQTYLALWCKGQVFGASVLSEETEKRNRDTQRETIFHPLVNIHPSWYSL